MAITIGNNFTKVGQSVSFGKPTTGTTTYVKNASTVRPTNVSTPAPTVKPVSSGQFVRNLAAEQAFVKNWQGKGGRLPTSQEINIGVYGSSNPAFTTPQGLKPTIPDKITPQDIKAGSDLIGTKLPPTATQESLLNQYAKSAQDSATMLKQSLATDYQAELDKTRQQLEESQNRLKEIEKLRNVNADEYKRQSEPFRMAYETAERNKFKIEQDYGTLRNIADEMTAISQLANQDLAGYTGLTGTKAYTGARKTGLAQDYAARLGLLQSASETIKGNIGVATNLIDRGIAAQEADRMDKINYINFLEDIYKGRAGEEVSKILDLTQAERKTLEEQKALALQEIEDIQANKDFIIKTLTDKNEAIIATKAGITLNDTPETWAQKRATFLEKNPEYAMAATEQTPAIQEYEYSLTHPGFMDFQKEEQAISQIGKTPDFFNNEMSLRKEYNSKEEISQYNTINSAYEKINALTNLGEIRNSDSAAQQAVITLYNKILDPNSVVREGEFDRTTKGISTLEQIKTSIKKIKEGGIVTEKELKEIVIAADTINKLALERANETVGEYVRIAEERNLSVENIVGKKQYINYLIPDLDNFVLENPQFLDIVNKGREEGIMDYDIKKSLLDFNNVAGDTNEAETNDKTSYLSNYGQITGYGSKYWDKGLDVDLKKGDPVYSPVNGQVIAARNNGGFGLQVKIKGDDGREYWLSHLDGFDVEEGDIVSAKQKIAIGGNTGSVIPMAGGDGSHLDITIKDKNRFLTPEEVKKLLS